MIPRPACALSTLLCTVVHCCACTCRQTLDFHLKMPIDLMRLLDDLKKTAEAKASQGKNSSPIWSSYNLYSRYVRYVFKRPDSILYCCKQQLQQILLCCRKLCTFVSQERKHQGQKFALIQPIQELPFTSVEVAFSLGMSKVTKLAKETFGALGVKSANTWRRAKLWMTIASTGDWCILGD